MDVNGVAMKDAGEDVKTTPPGSLSLCIRLTKCQMISTEAVALQCKFARCASIGIDEKKPVRM